MSNVENGNEGMTQCSVKRGLEIAERVVKLVGVIVTTSILVVVMSRGQCSCQGLTEGL